MTGPKKRQEPEPGQEPADVGEPGYPTQVASSEGNQTVQELDHNPET